MKDDNRSGGSARGRNRLVLRTPASWWGNAWREALPSGNGIVGAAVYGAVSSETVLINHGELWYGGKQGELPDVSHTLPEVRRMMDQGQYREASAHLAETLGRLGYESVRETPLPLADLNIRRPVDSGFRRYRRTLDMESGEVSVRWEEGSDAYERALFVSRKDDVIVCELRGSRKGSVAAELELKPHQKGEAVSPGIPKCVEESAAVSTAVLAADGYIRYAAKNDDGLDFGAVLRVIPQGGTMTAGRDKITVSGADSALLLIKVFVKGECERDWLRLERELAAIGQTYAELMQRHAAVHGPLFRSAAIRLQDESEADRSNEEWLLEAYEGELPPGLAETMWAYGRYLFISGTREDGLPIPLYGLWCGDYKAVWSHLMANENVQMMYWHTDVGGLSALALPMFRYYEERMEQFRDNARKLFGCRGIFIPAGTTPGNATPFQVVPVILNWTGAAGWLARHFYDYYLFTGDESFLRERALPFMREAALFYEDFFVVAGDGKLLSYPSVSPENTPGNFMPENHTFGGVGHPMPSAINATLDFAIAKELLTQLIEGSRIAGVYAGEIGRWEEMLARIPEYQINEDGAVKEWMHPDFQDRYRHRHISHIYPVFPAHEITREKDAALFVAFAEAVRRRLVIGIGDQTAWSFAHLANIYARMEEGELALECLSLLARSCLLNNFYTVHNDWRQMGISLNYRRAPVQMDANLGWVSAVQEMLLYVSPGTVKLLPSLPQAWNAGEARGLRLCTGSIAFAWNRDQGRLVAELKAERKTELVLRLPAWAGEWTWEAAGEAEAQAAGPHRAVIRMAPGSRLTIAAGSA